MGLVGASVASVSGWVKKGAIARERMRAMSAGRMSGRDATIVGSIAFGELWTYSGARRKEKRNRLWVWTAVGKSAKAADGWTLR